MGALPGLRTAAPLRNAFKVVDAASVSPWGNRAVEVLMANAGGREAGCRAWNQK